jgi:DNA gyrase subunit B
MISSQEIGVLITALGTGVGKEDKDPAKLRYHTVIIMTDADVDGSHIRTLLLTLFYRQFPELIDRGHIFIAQPPLFRVKRGKKERYLKDEGALEGYLLDLGTRDVQVQSKQGGPALSGEELGRIVTSQLRWERILERVARKRKSREIVAALAWDPEMSRSALNQEERLRSIIERAEQQLSQHAPHLAPIHFEIAADSEHGSNRIIARARLNGGRQETLIDAEFCESPEFEELQRLAQELRAMGDPSFTITSGDKSNETPSLGAAIAEILTQARKGVDIQRYTGLGEMNPEQLWETTMNPETRTLLQVRIEDAYEADEIFSTLMGDEVEPRRRFIEDNALSVRNLDI